MRLLQATLESLREDGLAGLSARVVATRAGVNQALVFYHFGSVDDLIDAAVRHGVQESANYYKEQFDAVTSFNELLEIGRTLHDRERALGNVAVMAQLMAGAQTNQALQSSAQYAIQRWVSDIEDVVRRVLRGSPIAEIADAGGLARSISAGFIGLELYEGIDTDGANSALDALESLGILMEVVDDLGPVARRALRAKVRRRLPPVT